MSEKIPLKISYEVRGSYWTHDGMVTVQSEDGRKKTTQLGGHATTPEPLAKIVLRELEDDLVPGRGARRA